MSDKKSEEKNAVNDASSGAARPPAGEAAEAEKVQVLEGEETEALSGAPEIPKLEERDMQQKRSAQEVESLKKTIEEKEGIIRDYENLLKKIQADFDNYRKRIEREREEFSKFVNEKMVRKLVTIMDDLERGLSESSGNGGYDAFRQGIEKIRNNTMQILVEEGLKEIPTSGRFDPYYHEAIVVEESHDYDDNTITEVYQKGFTLGGKVLRPAKVRVSRNTGPREGGDQVNREV